MNDEESVDNKDAYGNPLGKPYRPRDDISEYLLYRKDPNLEFLEQLNQWEPPDDVDAENYGYGN